MGHGFAEVSQTVPGELCEDRRRNHQGTGHQSHLPRYRLLHHPSLPGTGHALRGRIYGKRRTGRHPARGGLRYLPGLALQPCPAGSAMPGLSSAKQGRRRRPRRPIRRNAAGPAVGSASPWRNDSTAGFGENAAHCGKRGTGCGPVLSSVLFWALLWALWPARVDAADVADSAADTASRTKQRVPDASARKTVRSARW